MTNVELERLARDVVPPVGTTGWRLTVLEARPTTTYAVVPILYGLRDGRPVFKGEQRDCHAMYDLLNGRRPTLRSAPHSVAEPAQAIGPAERGAVPSGRRPTSSLVDSRTRARPLAGQLDGVAVPDRARSSEPARGDDGLRDGVADAGSPGASIDTHSGPGIKPSGVTATRSADAPAVGSSDGGAAGSASGIASASPGPKRCAACGRDLSTLPPSRTGQRRRTCNDVCRQAFHRGQRAPIAGVVDTEPITRLSRLSQPSLTGLGRDPDPGRAAQLALPIGGVGQAPA
jgi:hypothetical protein